MTGKRRSDRTPAEDDLRNIECFVCGDLELRQLDDRVVPLELNLIGQELESFCSISMCENDDFNRAWRGRERAPGTRCELSVAGSCRQIGKILLPISISVVHG